MNDDAYRRLCMTSVCGAILIPVAMALVAELAATGPVVDAGDAVVATATVADGPRAVALGDRRDATRPSPADRTTP